MGVMPRAQPYETWSRLVKILWYGTSGRQRITCGLGIFLLAAYLRFSLADTYAPLRDHWLEGYDFEHTYHRRGGNLSHLLFKSDPRILGHDSIRTQDRIPNLVHMIPPPQFQFLDYLAIASVASVLAPKAIYMHMTLGRQPEGWWWEAALRHFSHDTPFIIKETQDITEIYGRTISNPSHKADITRLNALLEYGGIYIDTDAVVLKSFDHLLDQDTVLAVESRTSTRRSQVVIEGLCNAIILAKKGAGFIRAWRDEYRSFDETQWNWHSVKIPWQMSKNWHNIRVPSTGADSITVLDHQAFFWPTYDRVSMEAVHGTLRKDRDFGRLAPHGFSSPVNILKEADGYAYHLWRSFYMAFYGGTATNTSMFEFKTGIVSGSEEAVPPLDPYDVMTRDSAFNVIVRKYLARDLVEEWQYARNHGLV